MIYPFICPTCGSDREIHCAAKDWVVGDYPSCCGEKMTRVYRFQTCTQLAKDLPENQPGRVLSGGSSSRKDWLEAEKAQEPIYEASRVGWDDQEKADTHKPLTDNDIKDAWVAAKAGPEQAARWRKDHVIPDPFREASSAG